MSDYTLKGIKYIYNDRETMTEGKWIKRTWVRTPDEWSIHQSFYPHGWKKWIVVGHWHSFNWKLDEDGKATINTDDDIFDKIEMKEVPVSYFIDREHKVIFCDQCTALTNKIDVLVVDE